MTQQLSPAARALLARRAAAAEPPDPLPREQGPLSFPQLTQWFFAHLYPQSTVFILPKILTLRGRVDQDALRRSLQAIVERHAALRTVYSLDGTEPVQRVLAARPVDIACHDIRSSGAADRPRLAEALFDAAAARPFDLAADQLIRAVLLRVADDEWRLQVTFHHIAFDGWSTGVFLAEFEQHYRTAVAGVEAVLPPLLFQVPDAAAWQRAQLDTPAFEQDRRYWRERLRGVPPLDVPLDHPAAAVPRHRGDQLRVHLSSGQWASVLACAREHACTPFAVVFAAWAVLTARRCSQTKCLLGVTLAGRTRAEWEPLIGNFVNVLPIVTDFDDAPTFVTLLAQVRQRSAEALAHQHFPFQQLAADIAPVRRSGIETLFPVLFNFRNMPLRLPQNLPDLNVVELTMPPRGTVAPLGLSVTPDVNGALLELDFDPDQITASTAGRWLDAYVTILGAAIEAPDTPVARLPVMGSAEVAQLETWNQTDRPRDRGLTLPTLLARQAAATPDRIAVTAPDAEWSYRDLTRQAQRIARLLRNHGIGPGSFVGVCMERCAGLVAALAGVLEAGAAYVPIDPSFPRARIIGMLEDAGVTLLLSGPGTPRDLGDTRWERLAWDAPDTGPASSVAARTVAAGDPAYLIYTSGSTGRPKGVVISQSAIVNELEWTRAEFPLAANDAVLQQASISFDFSIWEFWTPLISGARLVMAPPGDHQDPNALIDVIRSQHVSVLQVVPTMLRALLDTGRFGTTSSLRRVFPGGEALTWDVIAAFRQIHSATLINLYGPTEATINATFWIVDARAAEGSVPIGRPIANAQAHVLDRHGEPAPIGVPGELCLAGDGVALGYLGQPELTAQRFVPDPFRPGPGRMMYHTGDLARWTHDGALEFLGRTDRQVKLRGFRVELGEIEAALGAVPGVRAAAVVVQPEPGGEKRLVGYVEPAAATVLKPAAVRAALKQQLPDYMIPAAIVIVPALPITSTGKLDRAALLALRDVATGSRDDSGASDSPELILELALQEIWERVLGANHVGLDDDFFELGGHSLLAVKMVYEVERSTGIRLPLATLFKASTIRTLAPTLLYHADRNSNIGIHEVQPGAPGHTPFFMLTGDTLGGGFYCRWLARALNPERPFYAVPPLEASADLRLATIEGMAAAHVVDIRRLQPVGPYRLGGFCAGGLNAYEIARQLRAEGEVVELLLLVDAPAPQRYGRLIHVLSWAAAALTSRDPQARLDRRAYLAGRAATVVAMSPGQRLATIAGYPARLVRRYLGRHGRIASAVPPVIQPDGVADPILRATLRHHDRAYHLYRHTHHVGRVDLVRSRDPARPYAQQFAAWQRFAPGVVLHEAHADHVGVVFRDLPGILRDQLERVNTARQAG